MDWFGKVVGALKLGARSYIAVAATAALLLFLRQGAFHAIHADSLRDRYLPWIAVVIALASIMLEECIRDFRAMPSDALLMRCVEAEYALFRMVERRLCEPEISRVFRSVEDFIETAATIMNRRKSRAGRSLENHVGYVLRAAGIPLDVRPQIEGRPDIVIPGKREYDDPGYPEEKLFVVGVKTTCKDRWGQVVKEARRVRHKHILTTQRGIASGQLAEMSAAHVSLVVPQSIHADYPRERDIELLSIDGFIGVVRDRLGL